MYIIEPDIFFEIINTLMVITCTSVFIKNGKRNENIYTMSLSEELMSFGRILYLNEIIVICTLRMVLISIDNINQINAY